MNLFRTEEHAGRWVAEAGRPPGASVGISTLTELAYAWYGDRLAPDWRPRPLEESQAILDRLGLVGAFWQLRLE